MKLPKSRLVQGGIALTVAAAVVVAVVFVTAGPAKAKEFATLHLLEGGVEVRPAAGSAFRRAKDDQTLREGDTVRTADDGRAEIEYFDGSVTRLDFDTTFTLIELATLQNDARSKIIRGKQDSGQTFNRVVELTDSQSRVEIETPTATASVRGTAFVLQFNDDGSITMIVLDEEGGEMVLITDEGEIVVPAGSKITFFPDGSNSGVEPATEDELNEAWIQYNECELDGINCPEEQEEETEEPPGDGTTEEEQEEEEEETEEPPGDGTVTPPGDGTTDGTGDGTGTGDGEGDGDGDGNGTPPPPPPVDENDAPHAAFGVSATSGAAPLTVSFADLSTDPDGDPLTRQWAFGDGEDQTGGLTPDHTYDDPGDYTAMLTVTDPDGASDSAATVIHVTEPPPPPEPPPDTTPPDTMITGGPEGLVGSSDATFTFTSSEGGGGALPAAIRAAAVNGVTFFCSLDAGGISECSSPVTYENLPDGPHTFEVQAADAAGNPDPSPASRSWTIDATAPTVQITDGPSDVTNETSAEFAFTVNEPGAETECSLDGGAFAPCSSPQTYPGPLAEGPHSFEVRASDEAGNMASDSADWTIDTEAPGVEITSGPPDPTNVTSATFTFTADPGAETTCALDADAFAPCTSPVMLAGPLSEGAHTFHVHATDEGGNTGSDSYPWTIDTTPPDTVIDSGPPDPSDSPDATFTFHAVGANTSFECQLDGGGFEGCNSGQQYTGLEDGDHLFEVRATDDAGNTDSSPAQHPWTIDTTEPDPTPPDTEITDGPADGSETTDDSAEFSFIGSDDVTAPENLAFECRLMMEGEEVPPAFESCDSPKPYSDLAPGTHTFEVRAIDEANNVDPSPASRTWTVLEAGANGFTATLGWGGDQDLDLMVGTPDGGTVVGYDACHPSMDPDPPCQPGDWAVHSGDSAGGGESVTVSPGFVEGSYSIAVENFTCEAPFSSTGAMVTVFGQVFNVGTAEGDPSGDIWTVASVDLPSGVVTPINTISDFGGVPCGGGEGEFGAEDAGDGQGGRNRNRAGTVQGEMAVIPEEQSEVPSATPGEPPTDGQDGETQPTESAEGEAVPPEEEETEAPPAEEEAPPPEDEAPPEEEQPTDAATDQAAETETSGTEADS